MSLFKFFLFYQSSTQGKYSNGRPLSKSGGLLLKSIKFDHDLDDPLAFVHKSSLPLEIPKLEDVCLNGSYHVGVQTELEKSHGLSMPNTTSALLIFVFRGPCCSPNKEQG